MYPCPKCGKPNSSHDGTQYCGPCEEQYHKERAEEKEQEIRDLRAQMAACDCGDRDCTVCDWRQARIYELQGEHEKAAALLNV